MKHSANQENSYTFSDGMNESETDKRMFENQFDEDIERNLSVIFKEDLKPMINNESSEIIEENEDCNTVMSEISAESSYVDDDGNECMEVSCESMAHMYILLNEKEEESWFKKKEVAKEVTIFMESMNKLKGHCKCAKRKAKLQELIHVIKCLLKTTLFQRGNSLDDVFMKFYEITESEENTLEGWIKELS